MNKKGIKCIPLGKHLCGRLPRGMPLSSSIDVSATPLPPPTIHYSEEVISCFV